MAVAEEAKAASASEQAAGKYKRPLSLGVHQRNETFHLHGVGGRLVR